MKLLSNDKLVSSVTKELKHDLSDVHLKRIKDIQNKEYYANIFAVAFPLVCFAVEKKLNRLKFAHLKGINYFAAQLPYNLLHASNILLSFGLFQMAKTYSYVKCCDVLEEYDKDIHLLKYVTKFSKN